MRYVLALRFRVHRIVLFCSCRRHIMAKNVTERMRYTNNNTAKNGGGGGESSKQLSNWPSFSSRVGTLYDVV